MFFRVHDDRIIRAILTTVSQAINSLCLPGCILYLILFPEAQVLSINMFSSGWSRLNCFREHPGVVESILTFPVHWVIKLYV